jgi:hypothetical protein
VDGQTFVVVSSDKMGIDTRQVKKAGEQNPLQSYFEVEVDEPASFDIFIANITKMISESHDNYATHSVPQRVMFQNHPAITYETTIQRLSLSRQIVIINGGDKVFRLFIDKQNPLGDQIFATFRLGD